MKCFCGTSLSTSFRGYLTIGSLRVTGPFFFFFPKKKTFARMAVVATTATPTNTGITCNYLPVLRISYIS